LALRSPAHLGFFKTLSPILSIFSPNA
jgi:hypothetical protein